MHFDSPANLRLIRICTLGALAGIAVFCLNPVNSSMMKIGFLASIAFAWAGMAFLLWKRRTLRRLLLILPLIPMVALILPGREIDGTELRADYLERMSSLEETRYVWGGESRRGIDCSGLPRKALRDALLAYGLRNGNGSAIRGYVEQWWYDASARALGEGYRGYTVALKMRGSLRDLDLRSLVPGDLAVTADGLHILAYIGDENWIQADPGLGRVATLNCRTSNNIWFSTPVTLHRWTILDSMTMVRPQTQTYK
jgi:hypothetical protein